jgi:hypothetical protein
MGVSKHLIFFLVMFCLSLQWNLRPATAIVSPLRGHPSPLPIQPFTIPSPISVLSELKDSVKQSWDETIADLSMYRKRLPLALRDSISAGGKSFANTCGVLFPVAFVLCIRPSYPDWKAILKNGFVTGLQWSALSGAFVAGETLLERLRDKKDRINSCFGSGLSGAVANYKQGPWGMSQAFVSGVAFFYVIDKFVGGKDPFLAMTSPSKVSPRRSNRRLTKQTLTNTKFQPTKKLSLSSSPSIKPIKKPIVGVKAPITSPPGKPPTPARSVVPRSSLLNRSPVTPVMTRPRRISSPRIPFLPFVPSSTSPSNEDKEEKPVHNSIREKQKRQ